MIIIVEGPDNSGKSTLAKSLAAEFGCEVFHPGGKPDSYTGAMHCVREQDEMMQDTSKLKILDRVTCISDLCYQDRFHELYECAHIALRRMQHVAIVYCRPPSHVITDFRGSGLKPHKDTAAVEFARSNIYSIIGRYDSVFTTLPHLRYDYTSAAAYDQLVNKLRAMRHEQ